MTVQLAMYKGKGQIGNAGIRWWTDSKYSHCELVIDGNCFSASMMDGGVRFKKINLDSNNWDLYTLHWVNDQDVLKYFQDTRNNKYGWSSLITSQLFNRNTKEDSRQFCSQWCAAAMKLPNPATYSPATLKDICLYLESFNK
jgi:hypothetical protein